MVIEQGGIKVNETFDKIQALFSSHSHVCKNVFELEKARRPRRRSVSSSQHPNVKKVDQFDWVMSK